MCPTVLGRLETRTFILIGPAIIGTILALLTGHSGFITLIGLYLVLGAALDTLVYPFVIKWQPPWLTFALAVTEFVLLYLLAKAVGLDISSVDAIWWYWVSWTLAIWTKVVILPIFFLTWIENGAEFRAVGWSVPPEQESIPLVADLDPKRPIGQLAREFSSVREVPAELRELPAPSGVHRVPTAAG